MTAQDRTYDHNALRLEDHFGVQIVRGAEGVVVGKVGVFRGIDVSAVVSASPNAVAEAKIFQHDYTPGMLVASLGIASLGAAIGASRIQGINQMIPAGITIVSVGLLCYGGARLEKAYQALSKSIWWYNRDLKL
jgi:hypothetical protein